MEIIEETVALGVPFCHFKTELHKNQYNLTFTKVEGKNMYEVHLIPLVINYVNEKIIFDKNMRKFICDKVLDFMHKNKCDIYFNINCIGLNNEFLVWKFIRWIQCSNHPKNKIEVTVTEKNTASIRLFEFFIFQ